MHTTTNPTRPTRAEVLEAQARRLTARQSTPALLAAFLATEDTPITADIARARGWMMDELDTRGDLPLLAVALDLCPVCWAHLDTVGCSCDEEA